MKKELDIDLIKSLKIFQMSSKSQVMKIEGTLWGNFFEGGEKELSLRVTYPNYVRATEKDGKKIIGYETRGSTINELNKNIERIEADGD